jgi:hypothetical protein
MPDWFSKLLISAGLLALSWSFLRAQSQGMRRVGVWLLALSLGLLIWLWTGSLAMGMLGWVLWFALPVVQAGMASRRLRFSLDRQLVEGTLLPEEFPDLSGASRELRDFHFQGEGDFWLRPSPQEQAYRIFYHPDDRMIAALAHIIQGPMQVRYLILVTEDADGNVWITWDYPFAYGFKLPPHFKVYRCNGTETISELIDQHREFLSINEVKPKEASGESASIKEAMEKIFSSTMTYNIQVGMLEPSGGDEELRYSWKGTLYIAGQVLREVVMG